MTRIEVFADVVCPFTHVGLRRLVAAREARNSTVSVRVRAWPLEWVNGQALARDLVAREVDALRASVAPDLFTGLNLEAWPNTSIPAFGLAAAAYAVDDPTGEAVSIDLRNALFEDGLDISDVDVLRAIGERNDVVALDGPAAEAAVRSDWERGQARHVRGSPHFFVGDEDWFCPTLEIRHSGEAFEITNATDRMSEFYVAALNS
jgi:predicted DsbA family dithiol-disulfide isomerase